MKSSAAGAGRGRRRVALALIAVMLSGTAAAAQDAGNYPAPGRTLRLIVPHGSAPAPTSWRD